ncbi:MAG: GH3 auxin-responsive promoter family protein [Dehalococcoidia bacterium]
MVRVVELLRQGKTQELWEMGCGFLDLSLEAFMRLQHRMLLEQLELLKRCELGRRVMDGTEPRSVEEFRERVPLTTYAEYAPYLLEQREDVLPERPLLWQRTSGRSGEYQFKWVPVTERVYREMGSAGLAMLLLSTCSGPGDVAIREHDKFLCGVAPRPYTSGTWGQRANEEGLLDFLPPFEEAERMSFEERVRQGFELALREGLDVFYGLSSVLVAIGEQFSHHARGRSLRTAFSHPRVLARLGKALLKSKLARRPLLPKDIWSLKGLVSAGIDASVYRERIKGMWGCYPLHVYSTTESVLVALQTWDYDTMTFVPHFNLLEFIPEREHVKSRLSPGYQPETVLLDEVRAGERYEMVVTNFLGGPFVRYRLGDIIEITSLRNQRLNINLPQMVFHARVDDVIDIAGFTRLTEKVIWQAIENSGVAYEGWTVRKETGEGPVLRLYLEVKENGHRSAAELTSIIHEELKRLDPDYADLESMLGLKPLQVTLLPEGAFRQYVSRQRASGAELVHLNPPHLNPPDTVLHSLVMRSA